MTYEDERALLKHELLTASRKLTTVSDQSARIKELELALAETASKSEGAAAAINSEQLQGLSKQLLKKQQMVLELQAERSALKSRVQDLQAQAERSQRLLAEAAGDNEADPYEASRVGIRRSEGLTNRGSSSSTHRSWVELQQKWRSMDEGP